ncbi:MAG: BtpA/SgcQ family protein [Planctomycetota bacterium]
MSALELEGRRTLIGMVHLLPLPGAPRYGGDFEAVLRAARRDAEALAAGGVDAVLIENWGDAPFRPTVWPETIAAMARVVGELARVAPLPLGVNCLRNDARAALGLLATGEASFLRVNVHVGAAVTDQGLVEGRAWETLRERARLAPGAKLFADLEVKHARPLAWRPLVEEALDTARRGLADALVFSGAATGAPPALEDLAEVRSALPATPLFVGSGFDATNGAGLLAHASGAIVGTALKHDGDVDAPVDVARVRALRLLFDEA